MNQAPTSSNPQPSADDEESSKRAALAGQWRTPPLPNFPASSSATLALHATPPNSTESESIPNSTILPGNSEDYVKALREAYRRGAEAAAAMAAQGNSTGGSAVPDPGLHSNTFSCPNFQQTSIVPPTIVASAPATSSPSLPNTTMPPPSAPGSQQGETAVVPNPLGAPQRQPPFATQRAAANSPAAMPPPAPVSQSSLMHIDHSHPGAPANLHTRESDNPQAPASAQQRSMSLPDMNSYAAQQEDDKRQKRLARNRASARLRRLRKKNLVDAYETEVGLLEKTLQQLQAHEWGAQDNASALTEALSMDRGQQVLTVAERQEAAKDILSQQLQVVEMLEDLLSEQYVLHSLEDSPEFEDLKQTLQLSDEQLQHLTNAKSGWEDEWEALQTVKTSLTAMKEHDWLWTEGVTTVAEQFMSILHANQVSKFLLWTDHNAEAIDELDHLHSSSTVASGPVFCFGAENNSEGMMDEQEK
ncbi:predicted protein [Phaeodactylum tricornutum CCAP 1055/1]|jgi:hypothetical protein|uniref:BZIP domain-containing protein n=2 Tax=Phaeodactylum tricornutum TaxID=2850 RepID=B7G0A6_PHATC|nr:predicted protein [Phaeodactylum tricornutum CCAP 1055/1]EEC47850.1 predicted protein [Phaeodactylum tricornutum CCAP 1055/1]|eukprot:XP_002180442.1 predicted protein [Phaeodactylum tricornutum CCAP 1055/1]